MGQRENSTDALLSEVARLTDELSRAKEENTRLEKINEALIDMMPDPADIVSESWDVLFQNKASIRMFGRAGQRKCYEFYHGGDSPCPWCTAITSIRERRTLTRETVLESGAVLEITSLPLTMPGGSTASLEIARDISENRRTQDRAVLQTRKNEMLNRIILSANRAKDLSFFLDDILNAVLGYMDFTAGAVFLLGEGSVTAEIAASSGLTEELRAGMRTIKIDEGPHDHVFQRKAIRVSTVHKNEDTLWARLPSVRGYADVPLVSQDRAIGALSVASANDESFTDEIRDTLSSIGREIGMVVARMQAEEELKDREERWRGLFENSIEGVFTVDLNGTITAANSALIAMSGYTREEVVGSSYIKFCSLDKAEEIYTTYNSLYRTGVPIDNFSYDMYQKDGTERKVEGYVTVLKHRGRIVGFQGTIRDTTGRLRAEAALAEEKERLAVTLKSIGDGVITTDVEGNVVLINRAAELLTGFYQQEVRGKPLSEVFRIVSAKTGQPCEDPVKRIIDSSGMIELESDTILTARNGKERLIADSGSPIKDKDSNIIGVVLVFRDVTEKKRIDDELRKTQKLESLGILAGGIAHDYNNILTAIMANISLTKTFVQKGDRVYDRLEKIEKAAVMASRLNNQLLTFSRGGAPVKETLVVSELIRDSVTFALGGTNVKCDFRIDDSLKPVDADVGQISQVYNNIVINAQQAMPAGGMLTVCASNVTISDEDTVPISNGQYVLVSIADEGEGIPPENLEKIFDPFFTTKQKGSGLGLSISYSIVKNHDGYIGVQSKVGVGTTFLIYLPVSGARYHQKSPAHLRRGGGGGKVLVMDDEEAIREVAQTMLVGLGYVAETARDGQEAVEKFTRAIVSNRPFDLVIMDLTIKGGMGGVETLARLREIEPSVKAVVSSGYSNDQIMADFRTHGFVGVLIKPYRVGNMADVVDGVLRKNTPGNEETAR